MGLTIASRGSESIIKYNQDENRKKNKKEKEEDYELMAFVAHQKHLDVNLTFILVRAIMELSLFLLLRLLHI